MTKRYSILQKKLQELESELSEAFALPDDASSLRHQHYSDDIEQRFVFLKTLLSAEIASRPKKPRHLRHINRRLADLEAVFREWDEYKNSVAQLNHVDEASTCSCTESCLNDDGEASPAHDEEQEEKLLSDDMAGEEKETVEAVGVLDESDEENGVKREEERRINWVAPPYGAVAGGVVLGMVLMGVVMVRFSGCFYLVDLGNLPTPT